MAIAQPTPQEKTATTATKEIQQNFQDVYLKDKKKSGGEVLGGAVGSDHN